MKICVYCASSSMVDQKYFEATAKLAMSFVQAGVEVVYGGGARGLMGQLADTILELGGKIKGVIPRFMDEIEWGHKEVRDFEYTITMHERKARLLEGADAVVALPGGTGTLEELLETMTLKRLGLYTGPIVVLNTDGFYDPLRQMLERCVEEHFMDPRHKDMWSFVDFPEDVLNAINGAVEWNGNAIHFATR